MWRDTHKRGRKPKSIIYGEKAMQNAGRPSGDGKGMGGRRKRGPLISKSLFRAMSYLKRQGRTAQIAYVALVIATLAQLAVPNLVGRMTDSIVKGFTANQILSQPEPLAVTAAVFAGTTIDQLRQDQAEAPNALILAALAIVIFAAARGVFAFVQAYMAEKASQGIAFDLRNEIYAKIQTLSFGYFDRNQTGQLMIRTTDDVEKLRLFLAQGLVITLQAVLLLVATLVILFSSNFSLALILVAVLPLALVLFGVFGGISAPLFAKVQIRISALNTILQESLAGIKVVKAFAREDYERKRFNESVEALLKQQLSVSRTFAVLFPLVFVLAQIGQVLIVYFGGRQIVENQLSFGDYLSFSLYLAYVFLPIGQLGFIVSLMAQASASSTRIFEVLDAESEIKDKPNAVPMPPLKGQVTFKNVTFRYIGDGEPVLNDVSFEAHQGQTIALLGATGSGKTSIINLLPRFYDPSQGAILIDGQDIRDVQLSSLREQIGIVLQETVLFTGSIRDNIAFGKPDATIEEVMAAAKAAEAHDFIMGFPQGYDTPVGERGATLSGGQKQRVAIARALLLNPRLLILDDSTSSVDLSTEYRIQKALDKLMKDRTSFVIAQRISTVVNADLILVLEKGRIVATGKHEDLMENSAIYAEIYHSQLVGDAEDAVPGQVA
jgi:ATP-binding cassette, subfamily B, multidrug efflux pump